MSEHTYDCGGLGCGFQPCICDSGKRLRDAAKLMVAYWSDCDDEPSQDDLALVRRMHRVLSGANLFPVD